jgi:hypothetical protein
MTRRCLICSKLNPCSEHSHADQMAELARNDAEIAQIRANDNHQKSDIEEMLELIQAKEIASGVTLMTKNGVQVGNAIVVKQVGDTRDWYKDDREIIPVWLVETDFGNRMKLTNREILEWYDLGFQRDYESWWDARLEQIGKTLGGEWPTVAVDVFLQKVKEIRKDQLNEINN